MKCPRCESTQLRKNGRPSGKQRYLCKACGKQFLEPVPSLQLPSTLPEAVQVASNGHSEAPLPEAPPSILNSPDVSVPQLDRATTSAQSSRGIAILLLDAENLRLDSNAEKFLAGLCTYPLQVKIAFANWRNCAVGKLDAELFERGYQLIHVPLGQNSADAQMIAMGVSIARHYPEAKEVFVCSCDWLLTHLCNALQNQGLTVYRVRRQNNTLSIENRNTGESRHYSLTIKTEVPCLEKFIEKVEELINAEQQSLTQRVAQLSTVAALFQERRNLALNGNHANSSVLSEDKQGSIPLVLADESKQSTLVSENVDSTGFTEAITTPDITAINSVKALEKMLIEMIKTRTVEPGLDDISVNEFKTEFQAQYKKTADALVKRFQPNSSLIKFLRSRPSVFKLILDGKDYRVAIAQP
jgi:hypothetical protein